MAEKKVIEIEIKDNAKSLKAQYKEAVLEVQKLADAFGATSVEVQKAAKRAAELKDQIEDVNDAIQSQKGEGAFLAIGKSVSAVASGFSAVEGAMGLVGVESEELQKTLLRVQSAMALAQGLQGLEDVGRAFSQLKSVVTAFGSTALNAFRAMSLANKAFIATGIGLLIAGLGTVIAYWDDISKALGFANDEQEKYAAKQKLINEQSKEARETISKESTAFATLISRLKSTNAGSKEREGLIKQINKEYGTTLKNIKDETKFQEQLNKELASYLEYQKAKFQLQKNEGKIQKNLEVQDKLQTDINKQEKEQVRLQYELNKATKEFNEFDKRRDPRLVDAKRKAMEDASDALVRNNLQLDINNVSLNKAEKRFEHYGRSANEAAKKVDELTNSGSKYVENNKEVVKKTIKEVEKIGMSNEDLDAMLAESLRKLSEPIILPTPEFGDEPIDLSIVEEATHEINNYYAELEMGALESFEGYKNLLNARMVEELRVTQATGAEAEMIRRKYGVLETTRANEIHNKKIQMASDAFSAIGNLIQSFNAKDEASARKQFKISKAFNLAAALTNTYLAVTGALTAGGNPIKLATGAQFVEAGIAATVGLANVAKIASTQFNSGGGGDSPVTIPNVVAPNLNVVGDTGINQLATLQQQPLKAYVVSNDITSQQQFDMKVQQTAQI